MSEHNKPTLCLGCLEHIDPDDAESTKECSKCGRLTHVSCLRETGIFAGVPCLCYRCWLDNNVTAIHLNRRRVQRQINDLTLEIEQLTDQFETKSTSLDNEIKRIRRRMKPLQSISWIYIGMFFFVVGITVLLVWQGWASQPEVSIQFNVGEIIGGVLAGAGVATAGIAYALRTTKEYRE